jgi:hypothetical protein
MSPWTTDFTDEAASACLSSRSTYNPYLCPFRSNIKPPSSLFSSLHLNSRFSFRILQRDSTKYVVVTISFTVVVSKCRPCLLFKTRFRIMAIGHHGSYGIAQLGEEMRGGIGGGDDPAMD